MANLKTHVWADALMRRAQIEGAFVYAAQKGDPDAGIVLLKVSMMNGQAALYMPERNMEGHRIYRAHEALPEREVDALIQKRARYDPDIWVIEIEDKQGRHFLTELIVGPVAGCGAMDSGA